MCRATVDFIIPSSMSEDTGINGNGRGTIATRGCGCTARRAWPVIPRVLCLQPSSTGYVSWWGKAHKGGHATSTGGVRPERLLPWPCSGHGERVLVHGEDTSIPKVQEFGNTMPWHVRVCVGAWVRAMVPRCCLELLRWKLMTQWPWRGDDSEKRGSTS